MTPSHTLDIPDEGGIRTKDLIAASFKIYLTDMYYSVSVYHIKSC